MATDKEVVYTYDFGDNWEHYLTVEGRADPTDRFICLSGSGHPVAEDVGGTTGWEDLKKAYRTEKPTAEQRERCKWFEKFASNADPKSLAGNYVHDWDKDEVNKGLEELFERFERMTDERTV